MFLGGPTKSKIIRICTWLKSCCSFCIFTITTLRVKLMPTTADLSWISCRGAQVESLTSILIIQVGKFRTKIIGQSVIKHGTLSFLFGSRTGVYIVTLTALKYFAFAFSITSQGVKFQHLQKKINIVFTKSTILTSCEH